MTTTHHEPAFLHGIDERVPRVSRAVQGQHDLTLAQAANCGLFDYPGQRFQLDQLIDFNGTWSFSYVRSNGARYIRIEARIAPHAGYGTPYVQIDLTVRDAAGNSVASSDARIPFGFQNENLYAPLSLGGSLLDEQIVVAGILDADALASTLVDSSWAFEFAISFTGGAELTSLHGCEMPRFLVNDTATHGGVVPGSFQRDAPIDDDANTGLERILETLASARGVGRTWVSLAFPRQVSNGALTPNTGSTTFQYLTALAADSAPQTWRFKPRQVYPASAAGEVARFRVLYRMSAGAGTEKGQVRIAGNATGSPWATAQLNYTTTWTWSPWITMAARTLPLSDTLSAEGLVTAAPALIWVASLVIEERVV